MSEVTHLEMTEEQRQQQQQDLTERLATCCHGNRADVVLGALITNLIRLGIDLPDNREFIATNMAQAAATLMGMDEAANDPVRH